MTEKVKMRVYILLKEPCKQIKRKQNALKTLGIRNLTFTTAVCTFFFPLYMVLAFKSINEQKSGPDFRTNQVRIENNQLNSAALKQTTSNKASGIF